MNIVNPYILTSPVDTSLKMEFTTTVANTTVYLPIRSSDTSGKLVFDDGTSDVIGNPDQATHTFTNAGTYVIKYYGTATSIAWGSASTAQKQFLTKILDWGITGATLARFTNCSSLISVASNLESTTTNLYRCFGYQSGNPDVTTLDVSNVTNMNQMFYNASDFNQDLDSWDVSGVTNMTYMFRNAYDFNGDVSSWDTSSVLYMKMMFYNATSADPDMSSWNFSSVTDYDRLFYNSGLGTTNYDGFLNRLNAQRITYSLTARNGRSGIGDVPSTYTTSVSGAARTALLANSWSFTDDGGI
tara:strand:- start:2397 stop:3296 length:900 start_codon:yes stop_codon:yes gene_type:complete